MKDIEALDNQDDNSELEGSSRLKRMDLVTQLWMTSNKIDSLLRQKARSNWLKYGDSNPKYCHSIIRWRRLRNEVKGVVIGGQWIGEQKLVRS